MQIAEEKQKSGTNKSKVNNLSSSIAIKNHILNTYIKRMVSYVIRFYKSYSSIKRYIAQNALKRVFLYINFVIDELSLGFCLK